MTIDEMFLVQLFAILAMFLCVTTVTIITIWCSWSLEKVTVLQTPEGPDRQADQQTTRRLKLLGAAKNHLVVH